MICQKQPRTTERRRAVLSIALALVLSAPVQAAAISYSLTLCESLEVLRDPMNKRLAMNVAWKPQHALMLDRTMPYFELRNTAEEGEITELSLSIGDTSRNFDWGKMIEASPGVLFTLLTPDGITGGSKADTLLIKLEGLGPGEFVRFRSGISHDDPGKGLIQDYRMTLFQLDGDNTGSNSLVSVKFKANGGEETLQDTMPNFGMMGMPTSTTMAFPNHYMDMVMPFTMHGEGTIGDDEDPDDPDGGDPDVPEPASLVLLGSGVIGIAGWRFRRRRHR